MKGQRHGFGVQTRKNGEIYKGEFFKNKRHGKGLLTYPDGYTYDGDWVCGQ